MMPRCVARLRRVAMTFTAAAFVVAAAPIGVAQAHAVQSRYADANGVRLHYLIAGKGEPVVLLHGFAQTSHMWRPLMARLATTHTVLAARPQ